MMKCSILFLSLFLFIYNIRAQDRAIDSLRRVIKKAKEDTVMVNDLNSLSFLLRNKSEYKEGIKCAEKALQIAEKKDFPKGAAKAYNNLMNIYTDQGLLSEALEYGEKIQAIVEQNRRKGREVLAKKDLSALYNNTGNIYAKQGNFEKGLENFLLSLKIREELGNVNEMASSYNNIGLVYYFTGNYPEALKYMRASLDVKKKLYAPGVSVEDLVSLANAHNSIGMVHFEQGNFAEAAQDYTAALKFREEAGYKKGMADSYNNLGNIFWAQGNYDAALTKYKAALKIREEIGDNAGMAYCYGNLGNVYNDQGNYPAALKSHLVALEMNKKVGDKKSIAKSQSLVGLAYRNLDKYPEALENTSASLAIREEIGDQEGIAGSCNTLAKIYLDLSEPAKAKASLNRAISLSSAIGAHSIVEAAAWSMVKACWLLGQTDSAAHYLTLLKNASEETLEMNYFSLSENEKELYFATMERNYALYYEFTEKYHRSLPGFSVAAYDIALKNKGMALRSAASMRNAVLGSGDTLLIREYGKWMEIRKKAAKMYEQGALSQTVMAAADSLEKELVKKSSVFGELDRLKKADWKMVQAALGAGGAAIEFVCFKTGLDTGQTRYLALLIKKESSTPQLISLCTGAELNEILGTFPGNNADYVDHIYGTKQKASPALYKKIWQPLEEHLQGIRSVWYSPAGLLHKISFAALRKENGAYLGDSYALHLCSSTGVLTLPAPVAFTGSEAFTLFGGVEYSTPATKNEMWSYLPGTMAETESIAAVLKSGNKQVTVFLKAGANEETLKQKSGVADILHISTHGFFYPDPEAVREVPVADTLKEEKLAFRGSSSYADWSFVHNKNPLMRSGLVLAGANDVWDRDPLAAGEDGVLTAQEVSCLDLRKTKLVVLSACETGLGDISGTEGVYGLQRAFKMAGAGYLVMSLWQVPDKETASFMQLFYTNMMKQNDIPRAFLLTQQQMRKQYDPYYWAAFVLVE